MKNKILHHIAFTLFWTLIVALVVFLYWGFFENEKQQIQECMERGFSEKTCLGL